MYQLFFVFFLFLLSGCSSEYVQTLQTYDVGGEEVGSVVTDCGVEVVFNFDRQIVTFYNVTDEWRYTRVNDDDGYIIVQKAMYSFWDDGVSTDTAVFSHGQLIEIEVYDPIQWPISTDLEQYLCSTEELIL